MNKKIKNSVWEFFLKSSHSHLWFPFGKYQWLARGKSKGWSFNLSCATFLDPHFISFHSRQLAVVMELSSFILLNEPQPKGRESVWPLKYWTTASPELLAAVVTWIVRPFCLLQWNLSWVNDKCVLSSFMASFVIKSALLSGKLLISR